MAIAQREQISTERLIGVVVPVGALRGEQSIGVGEFPDLVEFANLCVKMGLGLIQILPVNDTGYESSPYGSRTAFALNPLYLRIGDLAEASAFTAKLSALKKNLMEKPGFPTIKYSGQRWSCSGRYTPRLNPGRA